MFGPCCYAQADVGKTDPISSFPAEMWTGVVIKSPVMLMNMHSNISLHSTCVLCGTRCSAFQADSFEAT